MRTKCLSAFVLTAAMAAASSASATALLVKHVPSVVAQHRAALAGALDPAAHMKLQVVLPMRNKAELGELAHAVSDPTSPLYRHYLSVAQFTRRFGPTQHDYDAAMKFFSDNGLARHAHRGEPLSLPGGRRGRRCRARAARQAQHLQAPEREPHLLRAGPRADARPRRAGAGDRRTSTITCLPHPKLVRPAAGQAQRAGTGSGPGGNFIGSDFRAVYYATGRRRNSTARDNRSG